VKDKRYELHGRAAAVEVEEVVTTYEQPTTPSGVPENTAKPPPNRPPLRYWLQP
jgi:hypothetical protein